MVYWELSKISGAFNSFSSLCGLCEKVLSAFRLESKSVFDCHLPEWLPHCPKEPYWQFVRVELTKVRSCRFFWLLFIFLFDLILIGWIEFALENCGIMPGIIWIELSQFGLGFSGLGSSFEIHSRTSKSKLISYRSLNIRLTCLIGFEFQKDCWISYRPLPTSYFWWAVQQQLRHVGDPSQWKGMSSIFLKSWVMAHGIKSYFYEKFRAPQFLECV